MRARPPSIPRPFLRRFYGLAAGQLFRDIGRFFGSASSELETATVNPWLRFLARERSFNHTNLWASSSPSLMVRASKSRFSSLSLRRGRISESSADYHSAARPPLGAVLHHHLASCALRFTRRDSITLYVTFVKSPICDGSPAIGFPAAGSGYLEGQRFIPLPARPVKSSRRPCRTAGPRRRPGSTTTSPAVGDAPPGFIDVLRANCAAAVAHTKPLLICPGFSSIIVMTTCLPVAGRTGRRYG